MQEPAMLPLVVVISGPSGVGKDALLERMAKLGCDYHFTITTTTRAPRTGELDGVNHYFVSETRFQEMRDNNELLESARVYGNFYGVPKKQVNKALADGKNVLIRVDVQGAARLRSVIPQALFIFVLPPSLESLRQRLTDRGVNSNDEIQTRLAAARDELQEAEAFDYRIVNEEGELDSTVQNLRDIIEREVLQQSAQH
jgi:guanylate kinase